MGDTTARCASSTVVPPPQVVRVKVGVRRGQGFVKREKMHPIEYASDGVSIILRGHVSHNNLSKLRNFEEKTARATVFV